MLALRVPGSLIPAVFILSAHMLDMATFQMALNHYDLSGEYGVLALAGADAGGILALKVVGVLLLVGIALLAPVRPHWRFRYMTFATVGGLIPALANLTAFTV
jgi:hypothetical protein